MAGALMERHPHANPRRKQPMRSYLSNSSNPRRRQRQRGFTVLEAMVAVVVAGAVASLAAPTFSDLVVRQGIRNASFELMSDLTFARSEA
jgi:type IV fimbrial biogenesis protein FimT